MFGSVGSTVRPEAMADVPGVCEVPLTRAVVQYREGQDPGGRPHGLDDLGLALVLDGEHPSRARVLDLGSGIVRTLDLSGQLVVLDWVYGPTLGHVRDLVLHRAPGTPPASDGSTGLERTCSSILRGVLERVGFGPLVRPTLLRLGFQDLARDLDPHESAAVRVLLGPSRVARIRLDVDHLRLVVATGSSSRDAELEGALADAFPGMELRRAVPSVAEGTLSYLVLLPVPGSAAELTALVAGLRRGISRVMARFEPARFRDVDAQLSAFGPRDSLGRLRMRDASGRSESLGPLPASAEIVH